MITRFKIFEKNESDLLQYIGTFLLSSKTDIALCTRMEYKDDDNIFAEFDYFEFKDNKLFDFFGDQENFSQNKLNKVNNIFMTPNVFYNKYSDLCENFYLEICSKLKNEEEVIMHWEFRMLKNCKDVLETIPELQHYVDAEKYNL